jgi:4-aminobutyrate aminotransferase/(S)-3-amino-2-methylpropionate transaminase
MSKNNYIMDTDGNRILDLTCPLALGYNHDSRIESRMREHFDRFLQGRVDCSNLPPDNFTDMLSEYVMPVAPHGLTSVHLSDGTITSANETAVAIALTKYAMTHKRDFTKLVALGFGNASHGSSIAMLSCSDKALNVGKVPTYNWPTAPMPKLAYPLAANEKANQTEEARCLAKFEEIIA